MSKSVTRYRNQAFHRQDGRCYYCTVRMCMGDPKAFAQSSALTVRAARWLRCTAEHLKAKRDGGRDSRDNIVAACLLCNLRRHRGAGTAPTPDAYRKRVWQRVARGCWHIPQVFLCGLVSLRE